MNADDLDLVYTALCRSMEQVGQDAAPLFLAMTTLGLLARQDSKDEVLALIARSEAACRADGA